MHTNMKKSHSNLTFVSHSLVLTKSFPYANITVKRNQDFRNLKININARNEESGKEKK